MKKPNITEGKWEAKKNGVGYYEIGTGWVGTGAHPMIAAINGAYFDGDNRRANAKAISAVPEMIDALMEMRKLWKNEAYEFGYGKYNGDEEKATQLSNNDKYVQKIELALEKAGVEL